MVVVGQKGIHDAKSCVVDVVVIIHDYYILKKLFVSSILVINDTRVVLISFPFQKYVFTRVLDFLRMCKHTEKRMSDEDDGRVHVLLRGSMKLLSDDRNVTRRTTQID